jgi:hypothetical protein
MSLKIAKTKRKKHHFQPQTPLQTEATNQNNDENIPGLFKTIASKKI